MLLKKLNRLVVAQYFSAAVGLVSAGGMVFAYRRIAPVPTVYHRGEVNNELAPDEFKHPKLEVRFGNVGLGPMFIYSMQLVDEKGTAIPAETILPKDSPVAKVMFTCSFFGDLTPPKTWQSSGRIPIIVIRPKTKGEKNEEWYTETVKTLKGKKLSLVVKYSWTKTGWFISEDSFPLFQQ